MDTTKFSAPRATTHDVDERIRLDAAAHPERRYSEYVAAAEEIAAESYRAEICKLAALAMLEPDEL